MNASIHHVNVTVPKSLEDAAKHFYAVVMGLTEVPKPPESRGRGGAWYQLVTCNYTFRSKMESAKTALASDTFVIQSRALQRPNRDSVRLELKYFPTTIQRLDGHDSTCAILVETDWRLRKDDLGL